MIYDFLLLFPSLPLSSSSLFSLFLSLSLVFMVGLDWRDLRFILWTGMFKRGVCLIWRSCVVTIYDFFYILDVYEL